MGSPRPGESGHAPGRGCAPPPPAIDKRTGRESRTGLRRLIRRQGSDESYRDSGFRVRPEISDTGLTVPVMNESTRHFYATVTVDREEGPIPGM